MTAAPFIIQTSPIPNGTLVALVGSADMGGIAALEQKINVLSAQRPARVVFDITKMTFISSICMGALVRYRNTSQHWNGKVVLAGANPAVADALRRARLDQLFSFSASVEEALKD